MTGTAAGYLKRIADQAAKRGERIVGYYGDAGGGHFRFEFAPIKRERERRAPELERPRRARRGIVGLPQGSLF